MFQFEEKMPVSGKKEEKEKKSREDKAASFPHIYLSAVRKKETFPTLMEILTHTFRLGIHKSDIIQI